MRILFVGGGSGGHFYPLIATAEAIKATPQADSIELFYMGPRAYNRDVLMQNNINYLFCPAGKMRRYISLLNILDLFKIILGIFVALIQLFVYYPDVIFSKGSYTSVPILIAAWFYRIPVVIHESDALPGAANKLAARFAKHIAISYPEVAEYFPQDKVALTGIPIRRVLYTSIAEPYSVLGIKPNLPVLFVTGGSSGAVRINDLILDSLDELLPEYQIVHQAGPQHEAIVRATAQSLITDQNLLDRYFVVGTLTAEQVTAAQTAATIVITRAGSTTLAEIALHQKPAIVIPIPEEVSHDQRTNAYAYARATGATVMEEANLNDSLLTAEIRRIMSDRAIYDAMVEGTKQFVYPSAAATIASALIDTGLRHGS